MATFFITVFAGFFVVSLVFTRGMNRNAWGDEITLGRRLFVAAVMSCLGLLFTVFVMICVGSAQAQEGELYTVYTPVLKADTVVYSVRVHAVAIGEYMDVSDPGEPPCQRWRFDNDRLLIETSRLDWHCRMDMQVRNELLRHAWNVLWGDWDVPGITFVASPDSISGGEASLDDMIKLAARGPKETDKN